MRGRPWWTLLVIAALLALVAIATPVLGAKRPVEAASDPKIVVSDRVKVEDPDAARFLTRVTYGATPAGIARFEALGLEAWVEDALHPGDDPALAARLAGLPTLTMTPAQLKDGYPFLPTEGSGGMGPRGAGARAAQRTAPEGMEGDETPDPRAGKAPGGPRRRPETPQNPAVAAMSAETRARHQLNSTPLRERSTARVLRAVYAEDQVHELVAAFWLDHFNVSPQKGHSIPFLYGDYEDRVIRGHQYGTFRELLGEVARSPAMLTYLDNDRNNKADTAVEARGEHMPATTVGLNENYARELLELHTMGVDSGYTQADVTDAARILTGWGADMRSEAAGTFVFRSRMHDTGAKTVLGTTFPAGGGVEEGERLLDLLAKDPATIRRVSGKMVRWFTGQADDAFVERVIARWTETGGDLRAIYRAILMDPALLDGRPARSPLMWAAAAVRTVGVDDLQGGELGPVVREMGQDVLGTLAPTGYDDTDWLSTDAMLRRAKFATWLANKLGPALERDGVTTRDAVLARMMPTHAGDSALAARLEGATPTDLAAAVLTLPEFQYR